jgi:DNA modification methylase
MDRISLVQVDLMVLAKTSQAKFKAQPIYSGTTKAKLDWSIYQGNSFDTLQGLKSNSVDCVVTSPPYFWLRDYGVEGQLGQEKSIDLYVQNLVCVMEEIRRVLKNKGCLFLNLGDTYYSGKGESQGIDRKNGKRRFGLREVDKSGGMGEGLRGKTAMGIPWRVAVAMMQSGWILRTPIIWNRQHCLPETVKDRPPRTYEYIFHFTKSRRYYFNYPALQKTGDKDIWTIAAKPKRARGIDTAPFPDELVRRCLEVGCAPNGTVLDPFAGSGTTMRVALNMGYSASGIDLNPNFCQYMNDQLKKL